MEVAFLVGIVLFGFVLGVLARFAVPGPDPMPIWLTTLVGVAGSVGGGLLGQLFTDSAGSLLFAFAGAVVLVIGYRRLVQGRGITGPQAKVQPVRGFGLKRGSGQLLTELESLRDAGLLTPDEFERKKEALLARSS